jgi:hypothetical protein
MSLPNRFGDISPRIGLSYQVMRKLVDSGAIGQHSYELRTEEADFAAQTKALEFLVEHGIVERVFENATSAGWRFTAAGCKRIQLSLVLHSPCRALAVRDVDLREMTVYELMLTLEKRGWTGKVLQPRRRRLKRDAIEVPQTYIASQASCELIWWVRSGDNAVHREYLLALALAGQHGRAVEHLRSKRWYEALLAGKPEPKRRPRRTEFQFGLEDKASRPRPLPRPPPAKRQRAEALAAKPQPQAALLNETLLEEGDCSCDEEEEHATEADSDSDAADADAQGSGQGAAAASAASTQGSEDSDASSGAKSGASRASSSSSSSSSSDSYSEDGGSASENLTRARRARSSSLRPERPGGQAACGMRRASTLVAAWPRQLRCGRASS